MNLYLKFPIDSIFVRFLLICVSFISRSVSLYFFFFRKTSVSRLELLVRVLALFFAVKKKQNCTEVGGGERTRGGDDVGGGGGSGQRRDARRLYYVPQSCVRRRLLRARIPHN